MKRQYWGIGLAALLTLSLVLVQPMQAKAEIGPMTNDDIIEMIESQSGTDLTPEQEDMIREQIDNMRDAWVSDDKTSGAGISMESIPSFNGCVTEYINPLVILLGFPFIQPEDAVSMNTVKNGNIVKTIHAEKEIFRCFTEQGGLPLIVDMSVFVEIFENIATKEVLSKQARVITCMKSPDTAILIDCESKPIPTDVAPVRNCRDDAVAIEFPVFLLSTGEQVGTWGPDEITINEVFPTHPQEMNTVNKGNTVKTVETQKEVFLCNLDHPTNLDELGSTNDIILTCIPVDGVLLCVIIPVNEKKVEVLTITEIWENLSLLPGNPITKKTFESSRCVVTLIVDGDDDGDADPFNRDDRLVNAESCRFSTVQD